MFQYIRNIFQYKIYLGGGWSQATRQWGENWKIIIFLKNQKDIFGALGNPFENQIGYVLASKLSSNVSIYMSN